MGTSDTMQPGFLSIRSLTKRYETIVAVDNLNLEIPKGELVAFLGPSGCGKSTSLRMIAGLSPVSSGSILIDGKDVTKLAPYKRDIGLVFQSYALFPHMTVLKNVMFGLEMRKVPAAEAERRAREAIAMVRLEGREDRRPAQLSGGQQQRVALARALVIQPSILLFDEPLSNLDAKLRDEMRAEIRRIQKQLGITSIFVTHDQVEALSMCDKVAVLNGGHLEQLGTPHDLYERPATAFVASFVGRTNRLVGNAAGDRITVGDAVLRAPGAHSGKIDLMVRPHRMAMTVAGDAVPDFDGAPVNRIAGEVRDVYYAGDILHYEIAAGGQTLSVERATSGGETPVAAGSAVSLVWRVEDTLVFGANR
ncbi:putative spermidine/putrescine transport system ATP-binding protein [Agrobacterium sp. SORGH_AS 745]|nr:putative spermidine/putrescine transport system ATP-binding protein [Agrobacterium sp. SORGH_AS_0745]CUW97698.1 Putative ABC transporter (ATP-binding protein) [Agrobacterium fabacearum TT111]